MNTLAQRLVAARAALCILALLAGAARAADAPASGNVYIAGSNVRTDVPVGGDFFGFGGRVLVDQPVQGDVLAAGGSVTVRGPVGDDVRAAGGDVAIAGPIGGELYAAGGNVALARSALVGKDAALAGGQVTIDGRIAGKLEASGRRIVVNGEVGGDAHLAADVIELGPKARIAGALSYASRELRRADGAVIGGALIRDEGADERRERRYGRADDQRWFWRHAYTEPTAAGTLLRYLGLLAAGALWLALLPQFSAQAAQTIQRAPWQSIGVGLGLLVGVPVLGVLLVVTLLGIPLALIVFAVYPLLLLIGYLTSALFIAQSATARWGAGAASGFGRTLGFTALALLALLLVGRLPLVGTLVLCLATIAGLGACALQWQQRRRAAAPAAG